MQARENVREQTRWRREKPPRGSIDAKAGLVLQRHADIVDNPVGNEIESR